MTNAEFNEIVKNGTSKDINWSEEDVVWCAATDPEVLKYLKLVVRRAEAQAAKIRRHYETYDG